MGKILLINLTAALFLALALGAAIAYKTAESEPAPTVICDGRCPNVG